MTCQHTMTLGVYLLGALDPTERSAFESHLSYCEICRGELVRLAPLPGLLNQITPEDFADNMPSTGVEGMTVVVQAPVRIPIQGPLPPDIDEPSASRPPNKPKSGPRNRTMPRRRFTRALSAAAAVVVLAVGAVFGWQAIRHSDDTVQPQAEGVVWTGESADGTIGAETRLIDREWGTEFQMKLHGMPPGRGCYLVVYDHYGKRQVAGWWGTDHDPNDVIPGSAWVRRSKIDRLEFLLDDRETVVLTIEAPR